MHPPVHRPAPPATLRLLAITAEVWGLSRCALSPARRPRRRPGTQPATPPLARSSPAELRQWPYWPDYPGAAIGWR